MAQIAGPMEAKQLVILVGGTPVVINHALNNDFNVTVDNRETTSKDSTTFKDFEPTFIQVESSGEFLYADNATTGFAALWANIIAGTKVATEFSPVVSGNKKYAGTAFCTSLGAAAPNGDNATFSASFLFSGTVTESTIV